MSQTYGIVYQDILIEFFKSHLNDSIHSELKVAGKHLMMFEKTLNFLKDFLYADDPDKKYIDKMKAVLNKLSDKAVKLEVKLESEKKKSKREEINIMLQVIDKQRKKGEKLIQERQRNSSSSKRHQINTGPELSPRIKY